MLKRIVVPTYNDRHKTMGWEKSYVTAPGYQVIFYEKDDSLPPHTDERIVDGWKIPNFGRSSFAFLWHIVKNYDNLADVEIFTKTHLHVQGVDIHRTISDSHNHLHLQAYNHLRGFLYLDSTNPAHQAALEKAEKVYHFQSHHPHARDFPRFTFDQFNFPFDVEWGDQDSHVPLHWIFVVYRDPKEVEDIPGYPYPALKEVFPSWTPPVPYYLRRENIWSVRKEVILANPIEMYQGMLDKIQAGDKAWTIHHDAWCEFWPLFWHETIRRMGANVS